MPPATPPGLANSDPDAPIPMKPFKEMTTC